MMQDDWGTPWGANQKSSSISYRNVDIKGHSKLLAVPFSFSVITSLAVLFNSNGSLDHNMHISYYYGIVS